MLHAIMDGGLRTLTPWRERPNAPPVAGPTWEALPVWARFYVGAVILLGASGLVLFLPPTIPSPGLFAALLLFGCLTSSWKVNLPISIANGSTLSVSYAANVMALLLLGPRQAVLVAIAGVWVQCTYRRKQPYPLHRTLFSGAAMVMTMIATGTVYVWLGGPIAPIESDGLAKPLVGAIATYFLVNTGLVAGAVALSTRRTFFDTWRDEFMWLAASFMAAGTAGALAAVVVERGEHWKALLLTAPIYLTYKTYRMFVGRLEDHKRHVADVSRLHEQTIAALSQARDAERALAAEKERLTAALEEKTRLEAARQQLLAREYAARASAEAANRLKDQFLATVSHELRTPLTAILGWADMLRRDVIDDVRRQRAVWAIHASAKRQAQLIDDLLDVSRIMSGKLRLHRTPVSLEGVVHDAMQVVQQAADSNGIRISVDADSHLGMVHGDPARLQQIACNLLSNAVKFTPPGGAVSVRLRRTARNTAEMTVTDTGEGITPHFLPSVFDPFRQADASTTRVHRGLGIGLSIVKNLVEAHGGTVSAHSAGEGRGATFIVELPLSTASPAVRTVVEHLPEPADAPPALDGLSVLVVDDDVESREVVSEYLRASRARVLSASSAAQALEVLKREQVDVLLADIGMPEEDGYSLIRKVRALEMETSLIPAAALTAFAREADREEALRAGFQLHLPKPIDARSLVEAVAMLRAAPGSPIRGTAPSPS